MLFTWVDKQEIFFLSFFPGKEEYFARFRLQIIMSVSYLLSLPSLFYIAL